MKQKAEKSLSAVEDIRNLLKENMKDLELKIEKTQSMKESLKNQKQEIDEEIKSKSSQIKHKSLEGEFDSKLIDNVKQLSGKIKDIVVQDDDLQRELDSLHHDLANNKALLQKTDEEENRI